MEIQKKKIIYLITKGNWGGAQRYVYDLATGIPKEEFDVLVCAGEGEILLKKLEEKNIRVLHLKTVVRDMSFRKDFLTIFSLLKLFRKERPDIIHINSSKIGALGAIAGRLAGVKKIIFTAHAWAFNEERPLLQKLAIGIIHWFTVMLCHHTIVVSEATINQTLSWPFAKNKLSLIHNGIEDIIFKSRSPAQDYIARGRQSAFWIGTISELHKNKGVDIAIEAYAKFLKDYPDSIFVIIGDGEEKESLKQLAISTGTSERVFFAGRVPNAFEYIQAFDIFTLTSRTEALPYVILEAGSSGVPIIASAVGGIPEIITSEKTGLLVRPENPKEVFLAMREIKENFDVALSRAGKLKEKIQKRFSEDEMTKKTMAIYKKH